MRALVSFFFLFSISCGASTLKDAPMNSQLTEFHSHSKQTLSDYSGRWIYLDFWASWCKPCVESFDMMNELTQTYDDSQFVILAVNVDEHREDAQKFLQQNPSKFRLFFDQEMTLAKTFGIKAVPSSVLISPQGKILQRKIGFNKQIEMQLREQLEALLSDASPVTSIPQK